MVEQDTPSEEPALEISGSRQFNAWLAEQNASLLFTTYQVGKLFFIGMKPDGRLSIFERTFNRCMGLHATADTFHMSTLYQLWRFDNALTPGQTHDGYDALYIPQVAVTTGDLDIHDITACDDGRLVFVNTLFSCLGTPDLRYSFVPLWQPPFITKLAAEDRCHLNGLAQVDGKPRYVTAISKSDVYEGWREKRQDGGIVMDIESNEIIAHGLSMPHSPRYYQGKLWLLNSGTGFFGFIDIKTGKFEEVAFCPGYLRGLSFIGDFAIMGLSKPRHNKTFTGLPLDAKLKAVDTGARCGLQVVDLRSGDVVHSLSIEGVVEELYDIAILPNVIRPMALGTVNDEICRHITKPEVGE